MVKIAGYYITNLVSSVVFRSAYLYSTRVDVNTTDTSLLRKAAENN